MDWAMKTKGYNQRRALGSIRVYRRRSKRPADTELRVIGVRAASVWLSASAHPAEARGMASELEEAVPALPRKGVNRS